MGSPEAVGNGANLVDPLGRAGREAPVHRVGALGLDAEHQALGLELLDRTSDAGDQTAAADRNDHRIEVRRLLAPLEADGRSAGGGPKAVEGMDE